MGEVRAFGDAGERVAQHPVAVAAERGGDVVEAPAPWQAPEIRT